MARASKIETIELRLSLLTSNGVDSASFVASDVISASYVASVAVASGAVLS